MINSTKNKLTKFRKTAKQTLWLSMCSLTRHLFPNIFPHSSQLKFFCFSWISSTWDLRFFSWIVFLQILHSTICLKRLVCWPLRCPAKRSSSIKHNHTKVFALMGYAYTYTWFLKCVGALGGKLTYPQHSILFDMLNQQHCLEKYRI